MRCMVNRKVAIRGQGTQTAKRKEMQMLEAGFCVASTSLVPNFYTDSPSPCH